MGSAFLRAYSSAISGWDLNLKTEPNIVKGIQVEEKILDYVFAPKGNALESPTKHDENNLKTRSVLNFIHRVLLDDDLENKYMIENSTLEAAEKSFYDLLNDDHNKKNNTICSNCNQSNSNDLFDIVSDLQKYKSSICVCNTGLNRKEKFENKLVRIRSFNSDEIEFEQGRSHKHLAVCPGESTLHEMFDNVLSLYGKKKKKNLLSDPSANEENMRKGLSKREAVDLRNLLTQCMKYLANNDNTSNTCKLLEQIRARACVNGDGTQRLAHYFANGLEARLDGVENIPVNKKHTLKGEDADLYKAFKLYLTAFPFMETSYFFANQMIMTLAEKKETKTIHIIHFGIMHGLQWPSFIQSLSKRPEGPPKLRITGIDFPKEGFRSDAMIEGTKNRLKTICERFNVPFEYNGFVKKWDNITLNDFKIEKNEVVVVNCLYHMMYLLDDTVEHSPRDVVLRLIKRVNPDLFVHVVVNGAYNSPFFMSRFREALFHYSTLFDMFDVNLPRDNPLRMAFEREIWGRDITNIIACEGVERVERPETYKQWQLRSIRAGFKQIPLNEEIVKQVKGRLKTSYHKDFLVDEAGHWLLNGWKGRAIFALSCWVSGNAVAGPALA